MTNTKIQVTDNGPILISGGAFEVQDGAGKAFALQAGKTVALCRCGQSDNKPFCDGAHRQGSFTSQVKAP